MFSMKFFVPVGQGEDLGVWTFDGKNAVRFGVAEPFSQPNTHATPNAGETLFDAMARQMPAFFEHKAPVELVDIPLLPGQYYPRMARPRTNAPRAEADCPASDDYANELASIRGQLVALMNALTSICQVVQPRGANLNTYGHEIRNLLILACTEVETQWKSVLASNGVVKDRYTTKDYVQLASAMQLGDYRISLPYFPWLPPFAPFEKWGTSGKPTQELEWYDAYNAVKHDREANFERATLRHAFEAVVACAIMLCAQVGPRVAFRWRVEFGWFFSPIVEPVWHPKDKYIGPYEGPMSPVNYPFTT
jgi:hypothetical protein